MNEDVIEIRKQVNSLMNESKRRAKRSECLWCGQKITSFCNSHSIPRCILKNIEIGGKFDYFNSLAEIPFFNADKGLNEAGVFRLLCRTCDSELFKEYENINNLKEQPSDKMLAEIALKNIFFMMNKRFIEREMHQMLLNDKKGDIVFNKTQLKIGSLDIKDYEWDYWRAKTAVRQDNAVGNYKMIYWKKLDHVIPIAFQGMITLYGDLEGNIANDVYDNSESLRIQSLHLCLFPMENESIVFIFCHQDDHNYDSFINQFNLLSDDERLQVIGYILFARTEEMFIAKKFPHRRWIISVAGELFNQTPGIHVFSSEHERNIQLQREKNQLKYRDPKFPNIFDPKYAFCHIS